MFDKHYNIENRSYGGPSRIDVTQTVTERKAPTDESIRLLNEFQAKAQQNFIDHIKVDMSNFCKANVFFFNHDLRGDIQFFIEFEFNGEKYQLEGSIDRTEFMGIYHRGYENAFGHDAVYKLYFDHISKLIAVEIVGKFHQKMNGNVK